MNKAEALDVLHEISDSCREAVTIDWVSLDPLSSQVSRDPEGGYLIKMKAELDNYSRECIMPILEKRKLAMDESKGFVVISRRRN